MPGHRMWSATHVRHRGHTIAIRARHRLFPWRRITVDTRDLRHGAEAVARHLDGGKAGLGLSDSRPHLPRARSAGTRREAPLPGFEPGFPGE